MTFLSMCIMNLVAGVGASPCRSCYFLSKCYGLWLGKHTRGWIIVASNNIGKLCPSLLWIFFEGSLEPNGPVFRYLHCITHTHIPLAPLFHFIICHLLRDRRFWRAIQVVKENLGAARRNHIPLDQSHALSNNMHVVVKYYIVRQCAKCIVNKGELETLQITISGSGWSTRNCAV